jgi:hypothetical protein
VSRNVLIEERVRRDAEPCEVFVGLSKGPRTLEVSVRKYGARDVKVDERGGFKDLPTELEAVVEVIAVAMEFLHDGCHRGVESFPFSEEVDLGSETLFEVSHLPVGYDTGLDVRHECHEFRLVSVKGLHAMHLNAITWRR